MHCPALNELPSPPQGKTGWPWTEESPQLPDKMPDEKPWPKISIVTPSYNQGQFLEETIRSVLLQDYSNLEYIIIDGGSTDNSVEIIKKYEPWLAYWVSEPDRGQSHALNKGFQKATGEIFGWLNSDDYFFPGALHSVGEAYRVPAKPCAVVGKGRMVTQRGLVIWEQLPKTLDFDSVAKWCGNFIPQAACLFPAEAFRAVGGISEKYRYAMDLDFWLKLLKREVPFIKIERLLACHRRHENAKTNATRGRMWAETRLVQIRHGKTDVALADMESMFNRYRNLRRRVGLFVDNPLLCPLKPLIHKIFHWLGR